MASSWVAIGAVRPTVTIRRTKPRPDRRPAFTFAIRPRHSRSLLTHTFLAIPQPLSLSCKMRAILRSEQASTLPSTSARQFGGRERMAWLYLVVAGLFEIGWPLGLKRGWTAGGLQVGWLLFAVVCII